MIQYTNAVPLLGLLIQCHLDLSRSFAANIPGTRPRSPSQNLALDIVLQLVRHLLDSSRPRLRERMELGLEQWPEQYSSPEGDWAQRRGVSRLARRLAFAVRSQGPNKGIAPSFLQILEAECDGRCLGSPVELESVLRFS